MKPKIYLYGTSGQYGNYLAALTEAGAEPVLSRDLFRACGCDGLLLPGGGDIGVTLEATDSFLIRSFADSGRPILGICRGMQALNVFFGGTLHARIPGHQQVQGDLIHPTRARGLLSQLLGPAPLVTSNHHQAVRVLGEELCLLQQAADGTIEGFCHETLPILGVQWHPERQSGCGRMRWMPGRCCGILWANAVANLRRDWYTVRKGGRLMKAITRELNLELGRPTADEALRRLEAELEAARHMNTPLLKLIHGYGSSGKGGRIRTASRKYLLAQQEKGRIAAVVPGERFSIFDETTRRALQQYPHLRQDRDLERENMGVTFIFLRRF